MSSTRTEVISWGSRLGSSIKGVFTGIILFVAGMVLLFWNEGRAVKRAKALNSAQGQTVSVSADAIDAANDGKAVHVSGLADTKDVLSDPIFGINVTALKFSRMVEYFQWVENKHEETKVEKKFGGKEVKTTTTTYSYEQEWTSKPVSSEEFATEEARLQKRNVVAAVFSNENWQASNVNLGAFQLTESIVNRIGGSQKYRLAPDTKLPENLKNARVEGDYIILSVPATPVADSVTAVVNPSQQTAQQAGQSIANAVAPAVTAAVTNTVAPVAGPQIGDVRVSFMVTMPHDITIVAAQSSNTFCAITTSTGDVMEIRDGKQTADSIFAQAQSSNSTMTWILRILSFIIMYSASKMVLAPLGVMADVVLFIGSIVRVGTGLIAGLFTAAVWLLVFAIAWLFYRPLLAIALLVGVGAIIVLIFTKLKGKPAAA